MNRRRAQRIAALGLAALCLLAAGRETARAQAEEGSQYVNFNFDRVDIRLLVKLVGEMTGRRFVLDDTIDAKVTVVTPPQIPVEEVYPLFLSVLESSGYSVVRKGSVHHIVRLPDQALGAAPVGDAEAGPDTEGIVTKVIQLTHVSAADLRKVLEPMVRGGKAGALAAFGPTNHLIITDTAGNIRRIEDIIRELDKPGSARIAEVVALKYAAAEDVARQMTATILAAEKAETRVGQHMLQVSEGKGALPTDVVIVPAPHANSLLLVGTPVQLAELKRIVALLDTEGEGGRGPLNAIFLKYLSAEEAAKSLNALLEKTQVKDQRRRVALEPNVANNALIVDAAPRDFEWVKGLVESLDQVPQQVLVEVLIVEVALGESLDLGFEWATTEAVSEGDTTVIGRGRFAGADQLMDIVTTGMFPQGLTVGIAAGTYEDLAGNIIPKVPVLLSALAQNRDVKILSSVPLWAQNNTEATVSVVENIPILKSTIEGGAGTARDVIQNIDRVDVGIKLKFTPHVNPDGDVTMQLNPSIEAIIDEGLADQPYTPTIAKREVSTTVTVPNKATIAISGLIREDRVTVVGKVPFLGDIPLLGVLFRHKANQVQRTNLLIFVTPHIVTDVKEATALREEWEQRTALPPIKLSPEPAARTGE
ncbi:MAG: type II secretion system secretin GspD [Kiritimatiellae bacterium]|nr:type II secretion system secretin GspD [Kiritimatiellia bacterium]